MSTHARVGRGSGDGADPRVPMTRIAAAMPPVIRLNDSDMPLLVNLDGRAQETAEAREWLSMTTVGRHLGRLGHLAERPNRDR